MKKDGFPKLLIISHNLYDTRNNIGKTLVSLLRGWPKEQLAQIYFRNDTPSFNYCSQYYCITDKDVLKSVATCHAIKAGRIVEQKNTPVLSDAENKLYAIGNHRHPSVSLIRDTMWDLGCWGTKMLDHWITEDVRPDLLLFVPNDYCLAYKVALHIRQLAQCPIVPFYMDDSFYYDVDTNLVDKFRRLQIRKLASKINAHSECLLTICDYMSDVYEARFGKKCVAFMNSVEISEPRGAKELGNPVVFTYMGNLHSNRWMSIVEIGKALEIIEKQKGLACTLRIYSCSYLEPRMKEAFDSVSTIDYVGEIPGSELQKKRFEADVLLHVEAFDQRSVNSLMLSLATRIPEYLSTGIPIFAYGPDCLSTIRYLKDNDLAQICHKKKDLVDQLYNMVHNKKRCGELSERGFERAWMYHDITKKSEEFQEILKNIRELYISCPNQ